MKSAWYYVYIVISSSRRAMYIGITNNLERRMFEHKNSIFEGFTKDYNVHRLVYFERFSNVNTAIAREKQLKGWRRAKKNALVETTNPSWKDMSDGWYEQPQGPSTRDRTDPPKNGRIGKTDAITRSG